MKYMRVKIERAQPLPKPQASWAVQVEGISKSFPVAGGRVQALQDVSLAVRPGKFVCLVGPSGCGKSTLLALVAGLERPDRGEVRVWGRPVAGPGPDRVVVFQEGGLFPWLTVFGNVELGLKAQGVPPRERRERVQAILEVMGLSRFARAYVHQLSGGMRQRVALARALVLQPRILLMDEPFAALDAQTRNLLQGELQERWMATGCTVLFVTHSVAEAVRLGDRVVVFTRRPGRVRREVPVDCPRPRGPAEPRLMEIRAFLLRELKEEVLAQQEEPAYAAVR